MSDLISRQFESIVVEYPKLTDEEHKGKPYYSIKYIEDGQAYIGYGTYKIEVLSRYIREYFMSSAHVPDTNVGELISRQASIEVASRECHELRGVFSDIEHGLKELPSADLSSYSDKLYAKAYERGKAEGKEEQKEPCWACEGLENGDTLYSMADWDGGICFDYIRDIQYCPVCGRKL